MALDVNKLVNPELGDVEYADLLPPDLRCVMMETTHLFSSKEVWRHHASGDWPLLTGVILQSILRQLDTAITVKIKEKTEAELRTLAARVKMRRRPRQYRHADTLEMSPVLFGDKP